MAHLNNLIKIYAVCKIIFLSSLALKELRPKQNRTFSLVSARRQKVQKKKKKKKKKKTCSESIPSHSQIKSMPVHIGS